MMSYGSEICFGGSDNVLEWDKPQCIFKFEKKGIFERRRQLVVLGILAPRMISSWKKEFGQVKQIS